MLKRILLLSTLLSPIPAVADTVVVWDFTTPVGVYGQSQNWVGSDGSLLNIQAFGPGSPQLVIKQEGGIDNGMGLTNSPTGDSEIYPGSFIQIAIGGAISPISGATINYGWMTLGANSVDNEPCCGPEGYNLWGTNTPGTIAGAQLLVACSAAVNDCNQIYPFLNPRYIYIEFTPPADNPSLYPRLFL